jgi:hypothetical protein
MGRQAGVQSSTGCRKSQPHHTGSSLPARFKVLEKFAFELDKLVAPAIGAQDRHRGASCDRS